MSKHRVTKYSEAQKVRAGELFDSGLTGKQVAKEMKTTVDVAYYLEYKGRALMGTLPDKRPFYPRKKRGSVKHSSRAGSVAWNNQDLNKRIEEAFESLQDGEVIMVPASPKKESKRDSNSVRVCVYLLVALALVGYAFFK